MKKRIVLMSLSIIILIILSSIFIYLSKIGNLNDVILSISTTILDIVITVFLINQISKINTDRTEIKYIATKALQDIHFAIWAWQGGPRQFDISATNKILPKIRNSNHIHPDVETLLIELGAGASNTLWLNYTLTSSSNNLKMAMKCLVVLSNLRTNHIQNKEISKILVNAISYLCKCVRIKFDMRSSHYKIIKTNASIISQNYRLYGNRK